MKVTNESNTAGDGAAIQNPRTGKMLSVFDCEYKLCCNSTHIIMQANRRDRFFIPATGLTIANLHLSDQSNKKPSHAGGRVHSMPYILYWLPAMSGPWYSFRSIGK